MAKSQTQTLEDNAPWKPPKYENADAAALQALQRGNASSHQQKRALDWILLKACATYDFPYRPGPNDRDTNIALGKMGVGQQITKLLNIKIGLLKEEK